VKTYLLAKINEGTLLQVGARNARYEEWWIRENREEGKLMER